MNIVVVGCGRVGAHVATSLDLQGHDVCVVDMDPRAFRRLRTDFRGQSVVGTGIDADVLLSAGIDAADAFFATTSGDNTNLMAAQVAKTVFQVPQVTARVYDPVRAQIFAEVGITTICPTIVISSLLIETLDGKADAMPAGSA